MIAQFIISGLVGIAGALVLLLVVGSVIRFTRRLRAKQYLAWRRLMWLPAPIYYWLFDLFTDNDGWRPLFYRERRKRKAHK